MRGVRISHRIHPLSDLNCCGCVFGRCPPSRRPPAPSSLSLFALQTSPVSSVSRSGGTVLVVGTQPHSRAHATPPDTRLRIHAVSPYQTSRRATDASIASFLPDFPVASAAATGTDPHGSLNASWATLGGDTLGDLSFTDSVPDEHTGPHTLAALASSTAVSGGRRGVSPARTAADAASTAALLIANSTWERRARALQADNAALTADNAVHRATAAELRSELAIAAADREALTAALDQAAAARAGVWLDFCVCVLVCVCVRGFLSFVLFAL